jgi:phosphopantothenoylcysteine decarboxylase/phosphopantothenate--cysteine ligase
VAQKKKLILGVTGSIAAYKAADIIRRLQDNNCDVVVVMTAAATQFITPLTLGRLSGNKVYSDLFEQPADSNIPHVSLADTCDLFLIAPATANCIGKIAYGIADDLLSCLALAMRAPMVIAPAMNTAMYTNAVVQENCKRLKSRGIYIIEPSTKRLACGVEGIGALAEVDTIVGEVLRLLQ